MKRLRIHYFQHVAFEGIGYIEQWATIHGHMLTSTKFYNAEAPPSINNIDWLIVMGGPMDIYQEEKYPWMVEEKRFIEQALRENKTIIGFCLGGQLIASALGAQAKRNRVKEIGWYPIHLNSEVMSENVFKHINKMDPIVFHWHQDMFEIPQGAKAFASSIGCDNQAFLYRDNVISFQFHLETTLDSMLAMIENCPDDYHKRGLFIQSPEVMMVKACEYIANNNRLLAGILNNLAR